MAVSIISDKISEITIELGEIIYNYKRFNVFLKTKYKIMRINQLNEICRNKIERNWIH